MGTRADFYIGRGAGAEWIGSIAWDGYPNGIEDAVLAAKTESEFRAAVAEHLSARDDFTPPEMGWPWPWDNSQTTDYAYAFEGGKVWASPFGHDWFDASGVEPSDDGWRQKTATFPDMSDRKAMTLGARSGLIVISS